MVHEFVKNSEIISLTAYNFQNSNLHAGYPGGKATVIQGALESPLGLYTNGHTHVNLSETSFN